MKLTDKDVLEIRDLYHGPGKWKIYTLAKSFKVSETTIQNIINHKGRFSKIT
jgi:plasmid maintenance system antidote protein VapI